MLLACLLMLVVPAQAQRFFNLTSSEVRVDSVLPRFVYSIPLIGAYRDSVYTVSLKYGEYIDMTASDIANYNRPTTPRRCTWSVSVRSRRCLSN